MSISLAEVIRSARSRHWSFTKDRVPDRAIGDYLSDAQNDLLRLGARLDKQFMAQTAVIALAPGVVGGPNEVHAGGTVGFPGTVDDDGDPATTEAGIGSLIEAGLTAAEGASVILTESIVTSATATTLTKTGAARTVNADVGLVLVITSGPGAGQRREVVSNTADTWTVEDWDSVPDATSLFSLIQVALVADETAGVIGTLPATATNVGYVVKLDASGTPYIDYTQPITANLEQGVPLPTMAALLPGLSQCWLRGDDVPRPLHIITAADRMHPFRMPAVYAIGQTLYACGTSINWEQVASLELRYLPIAPTFTSTDDVFLLPDYARPVLVALAGAYCAMRVQGLDGVQMDPTPHASESESAMKQFRATVIQGTRGRQPQRVRELW